TRPPPNAAPKRNLWQLGLAAALVLGTVVFLGILLIEPDDPDDAKDSSDTIVKDEPKPESIPEPKVKKPPAPKPKPCPEGMIFHRGGKLYVGSPSESPMLSMARPPHQVKVSSFCLDRYEVTVAKFRECSKTGECERAYRESIWPKGSRKKPDWERSQKIHSELCNEGQEGREQHPVNCVSWFQAKRFCETRGKRLPFEVEWEFAARGSDGRVYPWGDEPPGPNTLNACGSECRAWRIEHELGDTPVMYETDDGWVGTAPVGSYPQGRTQSGVDDMIGNLFEWTADGFYMYEEDAGSEITVDPRGPVEAERRIIRGGAFNSTNPVHTDPALRFPQVPDTHTHGIGFRCARNPDFEPPETKAEAKAEAEAKTKAEAEAKTEAKTEADST
ncbi:MAG TPA: formylglycine-generating enzyme family protein, partial [Nannocystis exedens]|nr:formylglycine-generating enzyme family protein [Nannocystis exedens]